MAAPKIPVLTTSFYKSCPGKAVHCPGLVCKGSRDEQLNSSCDSCGCFKLGRPWRRWDILQISEREPGNPSISDGLHDASSSALLISRAMTSSHTELVAHGSATWAD
eukprot:s597_g18.t1